MQIQPCRNMFSPEIKLHMEVTIDSPSAWGVCQALEISSTQKQNPGWKGIPGNPVTIEPHFFVVPGCPPEYP